MILKVLPSNCSSEDPFCLHVKPFVVPLLYIVPPVYILVLHCFDTYTDEYLTLLRTWDIRETMVLTFDVAADSDNC